MRSAGGFNKNDSFHCRLYFEPRAVSDPDAGHGCRTSPLRAETVATRKYPKRDVWNSIDLGLSKDVHGGADIRNGIATLGHLVHGARWDQHLGHSTDRDSHVVRESNVVNLPGAFNTACERRTPTTGPSQIAGIHAGANYQGRSLIAGINGDASHTLQEPEANGI